MFLLWHQAPFLRMALPFGVGVVTGYHFIDEVNYQWPLVFAACMAIAGAMLRNSWKHYRNRFWFGILSQLIFLSLGLATVNARVQSLWRATVSDQCQAGYSAQVTDFPQKKTKSIAISLKLLACSDTCCPVPVGAVHFMAYASPSLALDTLLPGDFIHFSDRIAPVKGPLNPGQFNFARHMRNQGYAGTVYLGKSVERHRPEKAALNPSMVLKLWREKAISSFTRSGVPERELGVLAALVLGKRELVNPEMRTAFAGAGVVHILAVSGLHVGIIYLFATLLFRKLLPGNRFGWPRLLIVLLILWMYAGITGFSPSVLRAATMFSFVALGRESGRYANIFNMLAASALLLLVVNPLLLFEAGFQLSYLAVSGIVIIHPLIYPRWLAPNAFLDKVWSLLVVSFSAQLATFPISVYYFNQFPNLFLLSNLIVIPLAVVLLYGGLFFILLSWIPFVSDALGWLVSGTCWLLNEFIIKVAEVPWSVTSNLYFDVKGVILLYLLFIFIGVFLVRPARSSLYGALAAIALLTFLFSFRRIQAEHTQWVAVLHAPRGTIHAAGVGKYAVALHPPGESPAQMRTWIQPFLIEMGAPEPVWLPYGGCYENQYFMSNDVALIAPRHIIFRAESRIQLLLAATLNADIVIAGSGTIGYFGEVPAHPPLKWTVIPAHGLTSKQKAQLRDELDLLKISYRDVGQEGALVLR